MKNSLTPSLILCLALVSAVAAGGEEPKVIHDIAYVSETSTDYARERCKLDLYLPANQKDFASIVWFHGGGLTGGSKDEKFTIELARALASDGIAVAAVNYRLSPKAKFPGYIEDGAAASAWLRAHIAEHGGDPAKVFIGGHSAGGYLSMMLAMDVRYFDAHKLTPDHFAGYIPLSGQTMTHNTIRGERGLGKNTIVADEAAPVYFVRKDTPPILILAADGDMASRAEENQYFAAALKGTGNKSVKYELIADRNHVSIAGKIAQPDDVVRKAIGSFTQANKAKR